MRLRFEFPAPDELRRIFDEEEKRFRDGLKQAFKSTAAGTVALISKGYDLQVYSKPPGAFGRPKDAGKPLAQSVTTETEGDDVLVFTNRPYAGYVEFGTGIYNTRGSRAPIRPRSGKYLAFPVWTLPPGFSGIFIPREKSGRNVPNGAIGTVLARQVKGMPARPVWTAPATEVAINRLLELHLREEGI